MTEPRAARGCGCVLAMFFLIPLLLLTVALGWGFRAFRTSTQWITTSGVIVDEERSDDGSGTRYPIIEFTDSTGAVHRFRHNVGSSGGSAPTIGESVEVLYPEDNPEDAIVGSTVGIWLGPMIFGVLGMVALMVWLVGRLILVKIRRPEGSEPSPPLVPGGTEPPDADPATAHAAGVEGPPGLEFRRVESAFDDAGGFKYRAVAVDDAGDDYYSEWLDEDPTARLIETGYRIRAYREGGAWKIRV